MYLKMLNSIQTDNYLTIISAAGAQQAVRHQPALDRHQRDDADRRRLRLRLRPHLLRRGDRHHQPPPARHHDHDRGQLKHGT